ncbi:hypothetical protein B0I37DRAFT_369959 [Chaetomium sp. MPI-CAGE-AT-0009]|nr:hypothetical protein B0I37DRAFT_369959 [Chaetomium sp. MPI-CAGE-AT-0009]
MGWLQGFPSLARMYACTYLLIHSSHVSPSSACPPGQVCRYSIHTRLTPSSLLSWDSHRPGGMDGGAPGWRSLGNERQKSRAAAPKQHAQASVERGACAEELLADARPCWAPSRGASVYLTSLSDSEANQA